MTFAEKVKKDNPNIKMSNGRPIGCPYRYGYEEDYDCDGIACFDCWNREMPNADQKAEVYKLIDKSEIFDKGLECGRNEAWELIKKLYEMKCVELEKIFDGHERLEDIFDNFTPQEALAKLKAYEEAQEIKVGDVVTNEERNVEILVTEIDDYERTFNGIKVTPTDELGNLGGVYTVMLMCRFKKTGKHIDIQSILEQIGE